MFNENRFALTPNDRVIIRLWYAVNINNPSIIDHITIEPLQPKAYISLWPSNVTFKDTQCPTNYFEDQTFLKRPPAKTICLYSLDADEMVAHFERLKQKQSKRWQFLQQHTVMQKQKGNETCASLAYRLLQAGNLSNLLTQKTKIFVPLSARINELADLLTPAKVQEQKSYPETLTFNDQVNIQVIKKKNHAKKTTKKLKKINSSSEEDDSEDSETEIQLEKHSIGTRHEIKKETDSNQEQKRKKMKTRQPIKSKQKKNNEQKTGKTKKKKSKLIIIPKKQWEQKNSDSEEDDSEDSTEIQLEKHSIDTHIEKGKVISNHYNTITLFQNLDHTHTSQKLKKRNSLINLTKPKQYEKK